jgi:hypothetical protein
MPAHEATALRRWGHGGSGPPFVALSSPPLDGHSTQGGLFYFRLLSVSYFVRVSLALTGGGASGMNAAQGQKAPPIGALHVF